MPQVPYKQVMEPKFEPGSLTPDPLLQTIHRMTNAAVPALPSVPHSNSAFPPTSSDLELQQANRNPSIS